MITQTITPATCKDCPHAAKTTNSRVFYQCSLFGGLVKEHESCGSVGVKAT